MRIAIPINLDAGLFDRTGQKLVELASNMRRHQVRLGKVIHQNPPTAAVSHLY